MSLALFTRFGVDHSATRSPGFTDNPREAWVGLTTSIVGGAYELTAVRPESNEDPTVGLTPSLTGGMYALVAVRPELEPYTTELTPSITSGVYQEA